MNMPLAQLLGRRIDDPEVEQFMRGLGPEHVDDDEDEDYDDDDLDDDEDETYRSFRSGGVSLLVGSDMLVRAIFLYSQDREDFDAYAGEIDGGIGFADDRAGVIRRLGEPSTTGGGGHSAIYGTAPQFIRYDRPDHSLHVEFANDGGTVSLVTLMTRDATPPPQPQS